MAPVWFVLDGDGVIRGQTAKASAKVRALRAEPRASLVVEPLRQAFRARMIKDEAPHPFSQMNVQF